MASRRMTLLAAGTILAGALATGQAMTATEEHSDAERFGHQAVPNTQLDKEHDITAKLVDVADRTAAKLHAGEAVPRERVARLHDFFVNFVDACHHAKEEQYYFPVAVVADPGLQTMVTTLELQHDIGRSLLEGVGHALTLWSDEPELARREAADDLAAYAALIRRHIDIESSRLMKPAEEAFSPEQRALVRAGFHHVEADQLGAGFHQRYHDLAMEILGHNER